MTGPARTPRAGARRRGDASPPEPQSVPPATQEAPAGVMLAAALAHAKAGRSVFPCNPDTKSPLTGHGFKDASRDPRQIETWWSQYPTAMIGMPTGKVNKCIVLDVDNDPDTGKDGDADLAHLVQTHGPLPETVESLTPRGGRHLIFQHPGPDFDVPNSAGVLGPSLDVRGDGGYIILPPSVRADGRAYQWEGSSDPDEGVRAAEAPPWLLASVVKQVAPTPAPPAGPVADRVPQGKRNETIYKFALSMRSRESLPESVILAAALAFNVEKCDPPLPDEEVTRTVKSAATKPAGLSPEYQARARPGRPRLAVVRPDSQDTGDEPPRQKPLITIRAGELHRVCNEAQAAAEAADCGIFQQGPRLVRIGSAAETDEDERSGKREPDAPGLYTLTQPALVDVLARHADWKKWDARSKEDVPTDPPGRVADIILSREGQWKFPRLTGYSECPCLTPDGRLIAAPGYDVPSGLMILRHPLDPSKILRCPLPDAGREAVKVLRECWSTFPFATPSDEAAAIAAALTAVHRRLLPAAPIVGVSASTPASGKSRLAETFGVLATGRKPAFFTAGHAPEELEKRLDAMLLTGDQVAILDNLDRALKSDALCSATTQSTKSVRVLGASKNIDCPTNTALILTGNNLTLLGDLQRRTLLIQLDAGCERPEERTFARDPIAYTRTHRAALLHAALTLPLAYFAAGCPDVEASPYGGFEAWDALVRRPLMWAGMPDPLAAAVSMREEDHELVGMRALLPAWWELWGPEPVSPSKILDHARDADNPSSPVLSGPSAELVEALRGIMGEGMGKMNVKSLGWKFRTWQGRILGGYRLTRAPRSSGGVRYCLRRVA